MISPDVDWKILETTYRSGKFYDILDDRYLAVESYSRSWIQGKFSATYVFTSLPSKEVNTIRYILEIEEEKIVEIIRQELVGEL